MDFLDVYVCVYASAFVDMYLCIVVGKIWTLSL